MFLKKWLDGETKPTIICTCISAVVLVLSLGKWLNGFLPFDISWIAIILSGVPIVYGAVVGLIVEHDVKADVLVSLALIASVITKEYFAAGEVAAIMQIGSLLEDFTSSRAKAGIQKLIKLTPQTATILRGTEAVVVNAEEVKAGDILLVKAGETIPVDGVIIEGTTTINQAVMTGESIPVDKKEGDEVTSGTINQFGTFKMKALKVCGDSSLQRMIKLAQQAEAEKAPIVHLADKWATWMVFASLTIAVITWICTKQFIRAVTVLVVFCPCAFILATPTAILGGIGNLTKFGILVRSGDALERLSKVKHIAFDKTGTLTYGKPKVTDVISFDEKYSVEEIKKLAASAEQLSEHPLGKAITSDFLATGKKLCEAKDFKLFAGKGISAVVEEKNILAGKSDFISAQQIQVSSDVISKCDEYKNTGATVIVVAVDKVVAGIIALSDTMRKDTVATIKLLEQKKIEPMLLTGDNKEAALNIAQQAGISDVHYELLPEGKMQIIKDYENKNEHVCMVGDGINDALALTSSYAGIAMGGIGSDIAVESADAVLISDDIQMLPYIFYMSKKTMHKVFTNLTISMTINVVAVTLSILGILNPITGALVHNCGSVLVVLNAALLLTVKNKK